MERREKNVKRTGRAPIRSNSRRLTENLPTLENLFERTKQARPYSKDTFLSLLFYTFFSVQYMYCLLFFSSSYIPIFPFYTYFLVGVTTYYFLFRFFDNKT